jgi:hypothetical protein
VGGDADGALTPPTQLCILGRGSERLTSRAADAASFELREGGGHGCGAPAHRDACVDQPQAGDELPAVLAPAFELCGEIEVELLTPSNLPGKTSVSGRRRSEGCGESGRVFSDLLLSTS